MRKIIEEIVIEIHRTEQDEGGYMYSIFPSLDAAREEEDPLDGGHCTSHDFRTALKMAVGHAESLLPKESK